MSYNSLFWPYILAIISDETFKSPAGAGLYLKFNMAKQYIQAKYPLIVQNSEPISEEEKPKEKEEEKPKKNRQAVRKLVEELREARFSTSSSDDY